MCTAGALIPRLEQRAADALIDGWNARDLEHLRVLGLATRNLKHLVRVGLHLLRSRIGRAIDLREHDALVFLRRELRLGEFEARHQHQQQQQGHHDHDRPGIEQCMQRAVIAVAEPLKISIDEPDQPAAILARAEECRAHHGRERQRDDSGDGYRAGQRECELGEQGAGETALKADRHVHRHQHHGHGEDRAAQLARRDQRGFEGRLALLFHMPIDVFDDDDGVIDHESYGEHQRQQRQ
jgi:hypothetical protein